MSFDSSDDDRRGLLPALTGLVAQKNRPFDRQDDLLAATIRMLARRAQQTGLFGSGWTAFRNAPEQPFGTEPSARGMTPATGAGSAGRLLPGAPAEDAARPGAPGGASPPSASGQGDFAPAGLVGGVASAPFGLDALDEHAASAAGAAAPEENGAVAPHVQDDAAAPLDAMGPPSAPQVGANAAPEAQEVVVTGARRPSADSPTWSPAVRQRIARAMAYFQSQGWTKAQAAGIVGNLLGENDTLDPHRHETLGKGKEGPGRGLAQWTYQKRKDAFVKHFGGRDFDQTSFDEQLQYVQHELLMREYDKLRDQMRHAKSAEATAGLMVRFERPANPDRAAARRAALARRVFQLEP